MMFLSKSEVLASSDRQSDIQTGILNYTVAKLLLTPKKIVSDYIYLKNQFLRGCCQVEERTGRDYKMEFLSIHRSLFSWEFNTD